MILTPTELKAHVTTSLSDDALLTLLQAAEDDIIAAAGPVGSQVEYARGGFATVVLAHPAGTVSEVIEYADTVSATTIASNDYRIDGHMLHRLRTGTNPSGWWRGLVKITRTPAEVEDQRKRAQIALIRLDITSGISAQRIGDWSASYGLRGSTYEEQKATILASLSPVLVG